jgi:hypothetical protein
MNGELSFVKILETTNAPVHNIMEVIWETCAKYSIYFNILVNYDLTINYSSIHVDDLSIYIA